ncbi:transcriptional regulator, XRE family [Solidesulfovibrio carbinoliphilus subsp. oakridgensis]|uniref:Transcriptional regulator, XRE family n=1 Tax=Solidesulfovibrio carbinoliphilus subsp. oakridgensis TaxID=694327 RepID=G7QDG4_9BACT|nr:helix-turn-helix transcriptional regulator [Solidesulfovibrio carbinoliphilus]EHJ46470.1 transcriptional regulator, XRE family [Solidesulfovibrio carbinoliphilus subsp. oakridgensis]
MPNATPNPPAGTDADITEGTANVFADLGFADADALRTKTRLAAVLNECIKRRKLKQIEVAARLGIPQPRVSALVNYRLDGFSVERLLEFLTAFDQDVEIMIRPRPDQAGVGKITVREIV